MNEDDIVILSNSEIIVKTIDKKQILSDEEEAFIKDAWRATVNEVATDSGMGFSVVKSSEGVSSFELMTRFTNRLNGNIDKDRFLTYLLNSYINDKIDAAYRTRYGRYPQYVAPMVTAETRSTTIKLVPRATHA